MLVGILSIEKEKEFQTFYFVWRPDRGFSNVSIDEPLLFCLLQIRTILHKVIPSSLCVPPLCCRPRLMRIRPCSFVHPSAFSVSLCFKCVVLLWSGTLFPFFVYPFSELFGSLLTPWPLLVLMSPNNCWWSVALNEAHLLQRVGNLGATMSLQHLKGGAPRAEAAHLPQNFRIPVETGELILTGPFWVMKDKCIWAFPWLCMIVCFKLCQTQHRITGNRKTPVQTTW